MDAQFQGRAAICTLSHGGLQYLCHTSNKMQGTSDLQIHVTDASDVWSADVGEDVLEELNTENSVGVSHTEKLRNIFEQSLPHLEVQGSSAKVTIQNSSTDVVTLNLFKMPLSEARSHLHTLMFQLVDRLKDLEKRVKAAEGNDSASASPVKPSQNNQQMLIPDIEARKKGYSISASQVKKRVPGESLINPGCKSKKMAKGVDFEDAEGTL
ncbi:protein PAXX [Bombina bombina]|uniref:protein PAXX n=1 Tax=Bombina bombina TaxID=8345 RepID=UPI00235AE211|nr:protein PAXX [Bombina bombina]